MDRTETIKPNGEIYLGGTRTEPSDESWDNCTCYYLTAKGGKLLFRTVTESNNYRHQRLGRPHEQLLEIDADTLVGLLKEHGIAPKKLVVSRKKRPAKGVLSRFKKKATK